MRNSILLLSAACITIGLTACNGGSSSSSSPATQYYACTINTTSSGITEPYINNSALSNIPDINTFNLLGDSAELNNGAFAYYPTDGSALLLQYVVTNPTTESLVSLNLGMYNISSESAFYTASYNYYNSGSTAGTPTESSDVIINDASFTPTGSTISLTESYTIVGNSQDIQSEIGTINVFCAPASYTAESAATTTNWSYFSYF